MCKLSRINTRIEKLDLLTGITQGEQLQTELLKPAHRNHICCLVSKCIGIKRQLIMEHNVHHALSIFFSLHSGGRVIIWFPHNFELDRKTKSICNNKKLGFKYDTQQLHTSHYSCKLNITHNSCFTQKK